jgi:hypothetical protein
MQPQSSEPDCRFGRVVSAGADIPRVSAKRSNSLKWSNSRGSHLGNDDVRESDRGGESLGCGARAQAVARTVEAVTAAIGQLLDLYTPQECANYLKNAGYAST